VDGLDHIQFQVHSDGRVLPQHPIATSPNMPIIPDFTLDELRVVARIDGRFYTHDPTLWPQYFFEGTWYYPYMRRRPDDCDIMGHPHRLAWHNLSDEDLVIEEGPLGSMFLLKSTLVEEFRQLSYSLSESVRKAKTLAADYPAKYRDMEHCRRGMMNGVAILDCAPQSRHNTLMSFASSQRYYLECLACFEYFTIWVPRLQEKDDVEIFPVDDSVMGAVTVSILEAQTFYQQGVPVWLIRPPSALGKEMRIVEQATPLPSLVDNRYFEKAIHPNTRAATSGPPSAERNRACQALRIGGINMGHSSSERQVGDINQPTFLRKFLIHLRQFKTDRLLDAPAPALSMSLSGSSTPSSRPTTSAVPRPATAGARNQEKFAPAPDSPFTPALSPAWKVALESLNAVARLPHNFAHPNFNLLRGYPFPDPFIFVNGEAAVSRHLVCWLYVRLEWSSRITGLQSSDNVVKVPHPQHWRRFMYLVARARGLAPPPATNGKNKPEQKQLNDSTKKRKTTLENEVNKLFGEFIPASGPPLSIHWDGALVLKAEQLSGSFQVAPYVGKQVVWELFENNFRLELLALDRCVRPRSSTDTGEAERQDDEVKSVFPRLSWLSLAMPKWDEGLGAAHFGDRKVYLENFRKLLVSWPGREAVDLAGMSVVTPVGSSSLYDETNIQRIEAVAFPFYCKTFFLYFNRAPSVPYQLPV